LTEHGKGWNKLSEPIVEACNQLGVPVLQIKEKFGGLRIYLGSNGPEWLYNLADRMEDLSYTTCENCGNAGKPKRGGWIKTLCERCDKVEIND